MTASQLSKCSRTRAPCVIWELPKFEIGNNLADVFFEALCGVMGLAPHRYLSAASLGEEGKPQTGSQPSGPGASGPPSHYEHVQYGNDDGRLHQGKGSALALHPAAGPALYKTGPVDCHRVPTSAPPGRKDGF